MKHLLYVHQNVQPLAVAIVMWLYRGTLAGIRPPRMPAFLRRHWRRIIVIILVLATLAIEAVMLWLLGEMISLSIDVMNLWAQLAAKHLEITL